jgi:CheY-like chemotaxis protein
VPLAGRTVLIVDDEPSSAEILRFAVERWGHKAVVAPHGRAALDVAERTQVDLILSDVMMPVMDGVELCRQVHKHPTLQGTPVILITAAIEWLQLEDCEPAAVLAKPLDFGALEAALERAVNSR